MALLLVAAYAGTVVLAAIIANVISQVFFPDNTKPPLVFHWIPFLGSTLSYSTDPYAFFFSCRQKYGDIFTFILLGQKTTVYLGLAGNEFILNGKLADVNAEEVYSALTTPVFGSDVVYDCPNAKLMEQKKFIKFGLTQSALENHVRLIEEEVEGYIASSPYFHGSKGTVDISAVMSQITIFTASRALQGSEVRSKLTTDFASLYHDLDKGFSPINFLLPSWLPLPHNRKRDAAHARMRAIYLDIINERRNKSSEEKEESDMIWNLMRCRYRDGRVIPDKEIAHMMITLLMAGQHQSASIGAWIILRLASSSSPSVLEELYKEQVDHLPGASDGLENGSLEKLSLHRNVIRETLRLHSSIHSIMRKVKNPLSVTIPVRAGADESEGESGKHYIIPPNHVLLASPGVTALSDEFFSDPNTWDPHRWDTPSNNKHDAEGQKGEGEMVDYGYGVVSKGTASPYLPFGAGRHRCIGEKFAYVNLGVILAVLVRHFKFSFPEGRGKGLPETDYSSLFSRPEEPAFVCWERRSCG